MRKSVIDINDERFDVVIVGAGINGCAAARDLSAEGYKVLLVDKGDFAAGATSRSGRIIHCGLRFMAPDKTVFEYVLNPIKLFARMTAAREFAVGQADLVNSAKRRLKPMEVVTPVFRNSGYAAWQVDIGAWLIGLFTRGKNVSIGYRRWPAARQASQNPFAKILQEKKGVGSIVALTEQQAFWPERIAIDAALNAERMGAVIRNYTIVDRARPAHDGEWSIGIRDQLTAEAAVVSARVVLNLSGAWIDQVNAILSNNTSVERRVLGVKGAHAVVKLPERYRGFGVVHPNQKGELLFCLPWDQEYHYVGPTHTVYEGDLDRITPDESDLEEIIADIAEMLPDLKIRRDDILMAWAGVRPITHAPGMPKGRYRDYGVLHELEQDGLRSVLALTWGIIANHRANSRRVVKAVRTKVGPTLQAKTDGIGGGDEAGSEERQQAEFHREVPSMQNIQHYIEKEYAVDLGDVLFRRTGLAWSPTLNMSTIETTARNMGIYLGWSSEKIEREVSDFIRHMKDFYHFEPRQ